MLLKNRVDIKLEGVMYIEGALLMRDNKVVVFEANTDVEKAIITINAL